MTHNQLAIERSDLPSRQAPAKLKPSLALVGAGYWGKNLARNFHELGALRTICDADQATLAAYDGKFSEVGKVAAFEGVICDSEISQVAIAAPAALHYRLAKAALEAGKDVFVEKPLCLDLRQATELVALAKSASRVLMVGHLLQYHPCIQKLQALLAQGELGKLLYITSNRLNLGKIRREENALWSFAPHDLSVILSLAGYQVPEQVRCTGQAYLNQGVADTTMTILKFAGGVRAHVYVSWLNPFKEQKLTIVGSNGMVVFDDTQLWDQKLVLYRQCLTWANGQIPTANKAKGEFVPVNAVEPLQAECQHFLACCRERRTPRTDGEEGLRVLQVLQAAQSSLEKDGEAVNPQVNGPLSVASRQEDYFVHPTAVVDDGAQVGKGTKVWHFCHIMKGAKIGERCVFGQNVNVDAGTFIGSNVKVQNNVSIYTGVVVEDDVFLGPSCVLTNVTNPRSQVNRHSLYERTVIRRGATVGANATIVCGVTIGRYAFVGAGAVVTKDVPDYALVVGNPARQVGWISRHGHRLIPNCDGIMTCPESGFRYQRNGDGSLCNVDLGEEVPLPPELSKGTKTYDQFKSSLPEPHAA